MRWGVKFDRPSFEQITILRAVFDMPRCTPALSRTIDQEKQFEFSISR